MNYKSEWTANEHVRMDKFLGQRFAGVNLNTDKGIRLAFGFSDLNRLLGLKYEEGIYTINNVTFELEEGYDTIGFVIGSDLGIYAILRKDDKDKYVKL